MVYYTYSGMRSPIGDFFIPGHIVFIYLLLLTYNNISMSLFDLKLLGSALNELEEERGIPKEKVIEAIEYSLGAAYKKEYGEKGQIVRSHFNPATGDVEFYQVKIVVDETVVRRGDEEAGDRPGDGSASPPTGSCRAGGRRVGSRFSPAKGSVGSVAAPSWG